MPGTSSTILIPDISGFTEFITKTELAHSSLAINMLIEAMVKAVGDRYEISEIEGDAILMIRNDPAPSKKQILDTCLAIFNAFHQQRMWMQEYTICPCGACRALGGLTVKFVAHYGPLAEIKVGRFVKHSGKDMIVAHRLLKNGIDNHEYLLLTDELWNTATDPDEIAEMEWTNASEEYTSIGRVDYRFALLNNARKNVPLPPAPQNSYNTDDTPYSEISIVADFLSVYMTVMNIPGRAAWLQELEKVEQDIDNVFIGSVHRCTFKDHLVVVSPLRMQLSALHEDISYAESHKIETMDLHVIYEFQFKKVSDKSSILSWRCMNAGQVPVAGNTQDLVMERTRRMISDLKEYCEQGSGGA